MNASDWRSIAFLAVALWLVSCATQQPDIPVYYKPKPQTKEKNTADPLKLEPMETDLISVEVNRGTKIAVYRNLDVQISCGAMVSVGTMVFQILLVNRSPYVLKFREKHVSLAGSNDQLEWTPLHLAKGKEIKEMYKAFSDALGKDFVPDEEILYDNDIQPGRMYSGDVRHARVYSDPKYMYYMLSMGDGPSAVHFLFQPVQE